MTSRSVTFAVPFVAGQARPRWTGNHMIDPPQSRNAKKAVARAFRAAAPDWGEPSPKGVPVELQVIVIKRCPKTKKKGDNGLVKPDIDNILKLVMDALNGIAYEDDVQVARATIVKLPRKAGATKDRMVIEIREGITHD